MATDLFGAISRAKQAIAGVYPKQLLDDTDLSIMNMLLKEPEYPVYPRGSKALPNFPLSPATPKGLFGPTPIPPVDSETPRAFNFFI